MRVIATSGSAWVAAKSYAIASPFALLFAFAGLAFLARLGARTAAAIAALLLGIGVIWSNVPGYGGVSPGPRQQLGELETIGKRFAGVWNRADDRIPALRVRHFLRYNGPGGGVGAASAADSAERRVDAGKGRIGRYRPDFAACRAHLPSAGAAPLASRQPPTLALPAGLAGTFPPRLGEGPRRTGSPRAPRSRHEVDLASVPRCADVIRLAGKARSVGGELVAAGQQRTGCCAGGDRATPAGSRPLRLARPTSNRGEPVVSGSTLTFQTAVYTRSGLGDRSRPAATLSVDGRPLGTLRQQLNAPGNYLDFGAVRLSRGATPLRSRSAVRTSPGSAGSDGLFGPLVISRAIGGSRLVRVDPARAASLCGRPWDWIRAPPSR